MPEPEVKQGTLVENSVAALGAGVQRSLWVVAEYPLECIKTRRQDQLKSSSVFEVVKNTYQHYGIKGFYRGFTPNLLKKIPVQMYRWPLLLQLPNYYLSLWQELVKKYKFPPSYAELFLANTLAGLSIAACETIAAAPFEACKLELIVKANTTLWSYLKHNALSIRSHYLGAGVLAMKEASGWVSFIVSCNLLRAMAREANAGAALQLQQYIYISVLAAGANAACLMPWDVIRTQIQKQAINKTELVHYSATSIAKDIVSKHGVSALWRGGSLRFTQLLIGTALSLPIMEKYDATYAPKYR